MSKTTESISTILGRADHGQLLVDANEKLEEMAKSVLEFEGKGKLTITLTVAKVKGKQALEITTNIKADIPGPPRAPDLYFADEDGAVSRKDPRQPDLPGTDKITPIR